MKTELHTCTNRAVSLTWNNTKARVYSTRKIEHWIVHSAAQLGCIVKGLSADRSDVH